MARLTLSKEYTSSGSATSGLTAYSLEGQRHTPRKYRLKAKRVKKTTTDTLAHEAATSTLNLKPQPTKAQRRAGNYPKGHLKIAGIDIAIENPTGSYRRPEWPPLTSHYGYIKRTEGADGDHVDVFVRNGTLKDFDGPVFVIDQQVGGEFDEHKVMLGWNDEESARRAYLSNYEPGWNGIAAIHKMTIDEFKSWLADGDTTKPIGGDPFESFVAWFMEKLAETIAASSGAKLVVKGDVPGHEFHGNQWTGGTGTKPHETTAKEKSKGLKELMASGHPFKISEIAKITGASTTYVSKTLKAMEGVDHKGLTVVKEGQHYKVVSSAGMETFTEGAKPGAAAPEKVGAKIAQAVEQQAVGGHHEVDTYGHKIGTSAPNYTSATVAAPAEKMTTGEADKHYANSLNEAKALLSSRIKNDIMDPPNIMQEFKDARAEAMAQWKANTTGVGGPVPQQMVYAADLKMYENIKSGMSVDNAFAQWKNDTAAEKAGTFNKPAAAEKPEAAPKTYVPADPIASNKGQAIPEMTVSQGLTASDFAGTGKSDFEKNLSEVKSKFTSDSQTAETNKANIEKKLTELLKESPAFQAVKSNIGGNVRLENKLVRNWAGTSNDSDHVAIAMQMAIRDEFGMAHSDVDFNRATAHISKMGGEANVYAAAAKELGYSGDMKVFRQGLMDFNRAQYNNTQAYLKSQGITELSLLRGMHVGNSMMEPTHTSVVLQPASSFSHAYNIANGSFGSGGSTFLVKVPASQVLGSYLTGFGCTNEAEIVLLASRGTAMPTVRMGSGMASTMTAAVAQIRSTKTFAAAKVLKSAGSVFYPDSDLLDADWTKQSWDLPSYKSVEFLESFPDLDHFRALPVYQHAVAQGLIMDDEWMGDDGAPVGARLKAVPTKR